jgi:DNA-binding NarL/FixJ family response regulator
MTRELNHTAAGCIRILIVDDHPIVTDPLVLLINQPGMEVVGIARNGDEALQLILETAPDVAILDVNIPGRGIFEVADEVSERLPNTKFLYLTGFLSDVFVECAFRSQSTKGFLFKGEKPATLIDAISRIMSGEFCISPAVREMLVYNESAGRFELATTRVFSELSSQQISILRHLATGLSVKEVAKEMGLSEKAVESQKYRLMLKLVIHDRVELTKFAIREGIITA